MDEDFQQLPGFRWLVIALALLGALLPLPTLLADQADRHAALTAGAGVAAVTLWMVLRVSRCGIRDAGAELVVRNPLRTVRIPWGEIRGFELGRFGLMPKVGVRLRSGRGVGIFALPVSGGGPDASTVRLLERYGGKLRP